MRTALISLAGQPRTATGEAPLVLAGKTVARRQLDFAIAAGCEAVIILGDGGSAEAIALRHAAEGEGLRFQAIRDSHGLLGAVHADDDLLVLAPGLLPEAPEAIDALMKGRRVLVMSAGPAVSAGFERIDLNRAWAGVLVAGGAQVERLADLPADVVPSSALVRIALQANVRETPLPEELLAVGSWKMLGERVDPVAAESNWLKRHASVVSPFAPTQWLGGLALRVAASRMLAAPHAAGGIMLATLMVLAASVLSALYGVPWLGFGLVALAAFLAQGVAGLVHLRTAPFGAYGRWERLQGVLPWLVDGALLACAVLAIEGTWLHRVFPALMMLGMLWATRPERRPDWAALAGDRGLLGVLLAVAAGFGFVEPVVMLVSLLLVALNLARSGARSG